VDTYRDLVALVMNAAPDVDNDLRDANSLSLLYEDFARAYRLAGMPAEAHALDATRWALWRRWNQTHPDNQFVRRQLAAIDSEESAR